jgi:hypothetical protein
VRLRRGELGWKAHLLVGLESESGLARYAVLLAPNGELWRLRHYRLIQSYEVISSLPV